jgi:hypothetical protein
MPKPPPTGAEVIDLDHARLQALFRCEICGDQRPTLLRVRAGVEPSPGVPPVDLSPSFVCPSCLGTAQTTPDPRRRLQLRRGQRWVLDAARQPVVATFRSWLTYLRRWQPHRLPARSRPGGGSGCP